MKTRRLIDSIMSSGGSGRTGAIAALIGGLAAGAVIGIKPGLAFAEEIGAGIYACEI